MDIFSERHLFYRWENLILDKLNFKSVVPLSVKQDADKPLIEVPENLSARFYCYKPCKVFIVIRVVVVEIRMVVLGGGSDL